MGRQARHSLSQDERGLLSGANRAAITGSRPPSAFAPGADEDDLWGTCFGATLDEVRGTSGYLTNNGSSARGGSLRVIDNQRVRRRIIQGGHAVARDNTAEVQSLRVAELIRQAVLDRKKNAIAR